MEFSELFIFTSFGIVRLWNRSSDFFWKYPFFSNSQKFCKNSSEISLGEKPLFWVKKTCFWGKNRGLGVKNRGFQTLQIYRIFGICSIPNFQKITKKMMLKSNFKNCEKLVPTQIPTQTFKFKFGMQGLRIQLLKNKSFISKKVKKEVFNINYRPLRL